MKTPAPDFNLEATLESGQVFGYVTPEPGVYEGVAAGVPARLRHENGFLHLDALNGVPLPSEGAIRSYFDLDRDLSPVYAHLAADERLARVRETLKGLRIIRQEPWEAFAGFVISANNNVKRIRLIWRNLAAHFSGSAIFPTPGEVAESDDATLRKLGLGYRAPYLLESARRIDARPEAFDAIAALEYDAAKAALVEYPGVGPKVADCILLHGFQRYDAFPVDVWILRAIRKAYFRGRRLSEKKACAFGRKRWGSLCGYVQQYIFHGVKNEFL